MMESDEIKSIQENLKDIQGVLSEIHGFMRDLKKDYSPLDESISLDSSMLAMLLNVSSLIGRASCRERV